MKPSEIEMANFLESLKAPQSRRIVDTLHETPLTEIQLIKKSKLSKRSIELHVHPLIQAKLVVKKKQESSIHYSLNKKLLERNADWFAKFLSN
ncbi:MAG: ArsR family transcriptional regulator [Acidobacteria bacterium]|nr:ArsR family transcriptional regulator [Acidobacteriota bacterium]